VTTVLNRPSSPHARISPRVPALLPCSPKLPAPLPPPCAVPRATNHPVQHNRKFLSCESRNTGPATAPRAPAWQEFRSAAQPPRARAKNSFVTGSVTLTSSVERMYVFGCNPRCPRISSACARADRAFTESFKYSPMDSGFTFQATPAPTTRHTARSAKQPRRERVIPPRRNLRGNFFRRRQPGLFPEPAPPGSTNLRPAQIFRAKIGNRRK